MFELLRTSDPVMISRVDAALHDAGIRCFIFDVHTSWAYGGALAAVASRMMVDDEDRTAALRVLASIEADARSD